VSNRVSNLLPSPTAKQYNRFEFHAFPFQPMEAPIKTSSHEAVAGRSDDLLKLATDIVAAYVSNNPVPVNELPSMIKSVHATLGGLSGSPSADLPTAQKPAVAVKKSITPEFIICLEDGKKLKMLKRYLRSRYGLSPEEYRAKWGLPADYPMVAPNYAAQRSEFAKKIGLGRSSPPAKKSRRG
jgi:predicted transcriptional regulator